MSSHGAKFPSQSDEVKVSVITPVRNAASFIEAAVQSVKQQNYSCEHIIIDDCSEDSTWDVLIRLEQKHPWIKAIRLSSRGGPIVARNVGLTKASGRYVAFLDADDIWLPGKLETQVDLMQKNCIPFTFTDYRCISNDRKKIGRPVSGLSKINWRIHHMTRFIACSSVVIDRSYFKDFVFRDVRPARRGEDFLAWADCIKKCGAAIRCPQTLLLYSITNNSRSSAKISGAISVYKIYRQVELIPIPTAVFYMLIYGVFSILKAVWQSPRKTWG